MVGLDDLNKHAQNRFDSIKRKSWVSNTLDKTKPTDDITIINTKKLQNMLDSSYIEAEGLVESPSESNSGVGGVIEVTDFIDKLDLPPNLSIAMAYIIASNKSEKSINLEKAIFFIEKSILSGE